MVALDYFAIIDRWLLNSAKNALSASHFRRKALRHPSRYGNYSKLFQILLPVLSFVLMKAFCVLKVSRPVCAALVAGVGMGAVSCSMPPREAWQRMRQDGVLKAFFVPKRMGVKEDRTQRLAGADLSVDEGVAGGRAGAPVAVVSDRPGYVWSPRTSTRKLVNVKDFAAGETVLCPYTLEPFVVPGGERQRVAEAPAEGVAGTTTGGSTFGPSSPLLPSTPPVREVSQGSTEPEMVAENPAVEEVTPEEAGVGGDDPLLAPPMSTAPFGSWVEGRPGHVYSPFAARHQLVDVAGLPLGSEVHCPFSGRIFRVPASADAAAPEVAILPEPGAPQVAANAPADAGTDEPAPGSADLDTEALRELATPTPSPAAAGAPKYGATRPMNPPPPPVPAEPTPAAPTPATPNPPPAEKPVPVAEPKPAPSPTPTPLPTATWAPNRPGLVQSPFGKPGEWVDVTGKPPGTKVVCPYSNKPFLVPAR